MNFIEHVLNFDKLFLIWQGVNDPSHLRYAVAELTNNASNDVSLRYLTSTDDFKKAMQLGFGGYPAFSIDREVHSNGVLEAFMRRIPSRKREDFNKYLEILRLKSDSNINDFTLLGYSGAKLPGDTFSIFPCFENQNNSFEFLMEVAGFSYMNVAIDEITLGATVSFQSDIENKYDTDAIKISMNGTQIGFVPRILLSVFHKWVNDNRVEKTIIERKNGQADKPTLYALIKISKK
jgi:hypothetical protein